jgi:hypothetical protein
MNGIIKYIVIIVVAAAAVLIIAPGSSIAGMIRQIKAKVGL